MSEAQTRFHRALVEHRPSDTEELNDYWLEYALSTNERGARVVGKVQEFTPDLRGRRFLDIGSGYGGVCIAAAWAGAEAVGVEIDTRLRGLAELNLADAPGLPVRFVAADVMDWRQLAALGRFDVITCDNVIEHVASPPVLLAHAARLLAPDGLLYLTVPNAFSFGQIAKECHCGQFGLSLLDPLDGERWVREILALRSYDVVYFRLAEYESLLARYGLAARMLNPVQGADQEVERVRAARRQSGETRAAATIPATLRDKVDRFLDFQLACCDADLAFFDALPPGLPRELFGHALERLYVAELWYFVASPDPARLDAAPPEPPWRAAKARVIVVLPAYNEEGSLGPLLQRLDRSMREDDTDYEILVVDDGSTDGTARVVDEYVPYVPIRLERHPVNLGLGATIRDGLKKAVSVATDEDIIVVMDADNTHTPGLIRSMVRAVREGADVVIASRYQPGSYVRGVPFDRKLLSLGARVLFQVFFPIRGVRDYTCGYRAYRALVLRDAFRRYGDDFVNQQGFQCMVDILLKLRKLDLIFREVPLILRYDLKQGASKMKVARTIAQSLALLVKRRFAG